MAPEISGQIIGQITTIFSLAGALLVFGFFVLRYYGSLLEPLRPEKFDNPSEYYDNYASLVKANEKTVIRWFAVGFLVLILVVILLGLQTIINAENAEIRTLNKNLITTNESLRSDIEDLKIELAAERKAHIGLLANQPENINTTLYDG